MQQSLETTLAIASAVYGQKLICIIIAAACALVIGFLIHINLEHWAERKAMTKEEREQEDIKTREENRIW